MESGMRLAKARERATVRGLFIIFFMLFIGLYKHCECRWRNRLSGRLPKNGGKIRGGFYPQAGWRTSPCVAGQYPESLRDIEWFLQSPNESGKRSAPG